MRTTTLCLLSIALAGACSAAEPRTGLLEAVENGSVSLTIEGTDAGGKLRLTLGNAASKVVGITLRQGETKIPVSSSPETIITIATTKAQNIDVPAGKEFSVTLDQVGKVRLQAGKITMRKGPEGIVKDFQNAQIGVSAK